MWNKNVTELNADEVDRRAQDPRQIQAARDRHRQPALQDQTGPARRIPSRAKSATSSTPTSTSAAGQAARPLHRAHQGLRHRPHPLLRFLAARRSEALSRGHQRQAAPGRRPLRESTTDPAARKRNVVQHGDGRRSGGRAQRDPREKLHAELGSGQRRHVPASTPTRTATTCCRRIASATATRRTWFASRTTNTSGRRWARASWTGSISSKRLMRDGYSYAVSLETHWRGAGTPEASTRISMDWSEEKLVRRRCELLKLGACSDGRRTRVITRRKFLGTLAAWLHAVRRQRVRVRTAESYARILGANDRLNFAIIGLNGRGYAHLSSLAANKDAARISHVCDVETQYPRKICRRLAKRTRLRSADPARLPPRPRTERHRRRHHRHARPLAHADGHRCTAAGKHVYVEKPCSHNPAEGALLIEAQKKYGKLVQMGTQQRSSPHTIEIVAQNSRRPHRPRLLREGLVREHAQIHRLRQRSARPANARLGSLAGPRAAPPYTDNIQPYNWHWFRIYGTGETLNNGTHEVDVCRWALGVDYPQARHRLRRTLRTSKTTGSSTTRSSPVSSTTTK